MKRGLVTTVFLFSAAAALLLTRSSSHRQTFFLICDMVEAHFFRDDQNLSQWSESCRVRASGLSRWITRAEFLREVRAQLSQMETSHLGIFDPEEDRRLWLGQARENGLVLRQIENQFVVVDLLPGSPAQKAGVLAGDQVISVEGEPARSSWQLRTTPGWVEFLRAAPEVAPAGEDSTSVPRAAPAAAPQTIRVYLDTAELKVDQSPRLKWFERGLAHVQISSFRSEYFTDDPWRSLLSELRGARGIVVDLRDNAGGNVVAMLRAISPFFCEPKEIGKLLQPRRSPQREMPAEDNLDETVQMQWLEEFSQVNLRTFSGWPCLNQPVWVLVDQGSASVSEIFVEGILLRPRTKVWGTATAGDVLVATWYSLPRLGEGYSLSIPVTVFVTARGEVIEGKGVWPQRELEYSLSEAVRGQDSWLERVREDFRRQ